MAFVLNPNRDMVPAVELLKNIGRLLAAAKAAGPIRADAGEIDIRIVLCGTVRQLIALDHRDPAVWLRYADLVLHAFRV